MRGAHGGGLMIEKRITRMMYLSLSKMHELPLLGCTKAALDSLAHRITFGKPADAQPH